MRRFGTLRTRIVVLMTIPLSAVLVGLIVVAHRTADDSVQLSVRQSLADAGSVLTELLASDQRELLNVARVVADDPRFFVTFSIPLEERGEEFEPTLLGVLEDFLQITDAHFMEVLDPAGAFHARVDADHSQDPERDSTLAGTFGIQEALRGSPVRDFYRRGQQCVVAAVVPVYVMGELEAVLRVGNVLDRPFLAEVRRLTGTELALRDPDGTIASTFPPDQLDGGEPTPSFERSLDRFHSSPVFTWEGENVGYLMMGVQFHGSEQERPFHVLLGRDMKSELAPLRSMEARMAAIGLVGIIVTVIAGYLAASSVTRPLARVVEAAQEVERGHYDKPLVVSGVDEVAYLARSFDEMRDSLRRHMKHLEDVDKMKSDFIALAGHELKTPLTVITSFNELIVSGDMGELPADVRDMSSIIRRQLTDLNDLVQNILDLSALEQGVDPLQVETCDLVRVAREVAEEQTELRGDRDVDLRQDYADAITVAATCEPDRIRKAIRMVLDNAIRFTPDGGDVVLSVYQRAQEAVVEVRDNGIGIPADEIDWIFDKGYEVGDIMKHRSGKLEFGTHGFGLGLALCKAIVERHGGRIEVESTLGQGSVFRIVLHAKERVATLQPV